MAYSIVKLKKCYVPVDEDVYLKSTTIDIGSGQRIALIGTRHSGRTTLLRLLGNFYMCYQGEILIDGKIPSEKTKVVTSFIGDLDALPYEFSLETTSALYKTFYPDYDEDLFFSLLDKYNIDRKIKPRKGTKLEAQEAGIFLFVSRKAKLYLMDVYRDYNEITDWMDMMNTIETNIPEGSTFIFVAESDRVIRQFSDHVIYMKERRIADYITTDEFFDKYGSLRNLERMEEDYDDYEDEEDDEYEESDISN